MLRLTVSPEEYLRINDNIKIVFLGGTNNHLKKKTGFFGYYRMNEHCDSADSYNETDTCNKTYSYSNANNNNKICLLYTSLLHIILYFVVDALCIQSILVNKLHCRS